jgi:hypothetical protein
MSTPQLRSSQVVMTFGPGAMVDLPDASVIISGLDHWRYDNGKLPMIKEPRLVAKLCELLKVESLTLRSPPPSIDLPGAFRPDIVAWRFPEWFIVQKTENSRLGFRTRRLVHLNGLVAGHYPDPETRKKIPVVPVRFVRACTKGHVGDIDWIEFVHGTRTPCGRDRLWMEERGTSGDLDEVWITCDCGAARAMSQAARKDLRAMGMCNGSRPWLGPGNRERCGDFNRLLIRSASNAYFPQSLSVISIPDSRKPVDDATRSLWADFLSDVEDVAELAKCRRKPTVAGTLQGFTDDEVMDSIKRVRGGGTGFERPVKEVEFAALSEARDELGSDAPDGDFFARSIPSKIWDAPWMKAFERIVLVHRLREVIAQVGFTRFESAGPDIQGDLSMDVQPARLAMDANWLPAIENRGEGVFLQFKSEMIDRWLAKSAVVARGLRLAIGFDQWKKEHSESGRVFFGLPYYMIHSFSHLLLTAISLECGYPASSLRERVYVTGGRYGLLIFTGSSDAEGTLGGLVEAGRNIKRHIRRALELGELCSNDPVCAYHTPSAHDHQPLIGSACHGCLLIAETSCEQHNDFLDRSLVVPTVEALGAEFFEGAL